jgi:cytochrome c556
MMELTTQKNMACRKLGALLMAACCGLGASGLSTTARSADAVSRDGPRREAGSADDERAAIVFARRNLMAAIGRNMDGITGMVEPGGKLDPADAAEHADEIAVMLLAFAHLFPPGTDNWSAQRERDDPAGVSQAGAAVWRRSATFRAMARAASQTATAASRAPDEAQFRTGAAALEAQCEACHAQFRRDEKPYQIPIPARN